MQYGFDRAKLPNGLSYPLRRSLLDQALETAGIARIHVVYYLLRKAGSLVLSADYSGEKEMRGWAAAGMSAITVCAVPSDQRQAIEQQILDVGLPRLIKWLSDIEQADGLLRDNHQHFAANYEAGALVITTDKPLLKRPRRG